MFSFKHNFNKNIFLNQEVNCIIKKRACPALFYGGRYKARTCDPLNVVQVRYQLRQSPKYLVVIVGSSASSQKT